MSRLDAMLEPGEKIRFGGSKPSIWPAYVVFVVVAVIALPIVTLGVAAANGMVRLLPFLLVAGIGGGVLLLILLAFLLDRAGSGLLVTDRRIIWREGLLPRRILSLDSAAIQSAEAYSGNGVLHLWLADETLRRIAWLEASDSIVRALGCRARIWPARLEPDTPFTVRLLGMATILLPLGFYELAMILNLYMGIGETAKKAIAFGLAIILGFFASYLSSEAMHIFAGRLMTPDARQAFACWRLNRRCQGKEPWPEEDGPWWIRVDRAYARVIVRRFYGGNLDCDCEPEIVTPGENGKSGAP